jgi:hypothetical protein
MSASSAQGHALAIERIQAAEAVAEVRQPRRKRRQALEASPHLVRVADQVHRTVGFSTADCIKEVGLVEAGRELEKVCVVAGTRVVPAQPHQRHDPAIPLDREHHT